MQEVEVQVDGFPQAPGPHPLPFDISGFADFAVAGTDVSACPMCGGTVWEHRPPRFVD